MEESWIRRVKESEIFVVIGTENYFREDRCRKQMEYAKFLGKPFLALIKKGVTVPPNYFDGVDLILTGYWRNQEELFEVAKELLREITTKLVSH